MENINYSSFGGFAISKELFEWIVDNIPEGSVILELGSGYGTRELVKKYKVYSVEHNKEWLGLEPKSNYIYAPLKDGWYEREVLYNEIPKKYDVLLIDGPPNGYRKNIIKNYDLFEDVKCIIVDDTNRNDDMEIAKFIIEMKNCDYYEIESENKKFMVINILDYEN